MKHTILKSMITLAGFFGILPVTAQTETLPAFTPGDNVTVERGVEYIFSPTQSGYLTIYNNKGLANPTAFGFLYSDADCQEKVALTDSYYNGSLTLMLYEVTQGETYYVKGTFEPSYNSANIKVTLTDEIVLSLASVDPTPGKIFDDFSYVSGAIISFFPQVVSIAEKTFTYIPEGETEATTVPLTCNLTGQNTYNAKIWDLYNAAEMGTDCYMTLSNVTYNGIAITGNLLEGNDAVTVENGTVTIHYPTPKVAFEILEENIPEAIYAYFNPENPEGKLSLTFSENLESIGEAILIFGTHSYGVEGSGDSEKIDPQTYVNYSIDGATLTINFGGINYSNIEGVSEYSSVTLMVFNITGEDGQSYPKGAAPYEIVLPFINENYPGDEPPTYMTETCKIVYPSIGEFIETLDEFVVSWGEPVSLVNTNSLVQVQIVTEVPLYAPASINADGDLVINVSQWSMMEGKPVVGLYTLVINEGLVKNEDGDINVAKNLTYNLRAQQTSAINTIISEDTPLEIYTLAGQKVKATSLKNLPKGIYIINGKKVAL